MRIVGLLLGFLVLGSVGPAHWVVAQTAPQDPVASQTESAAAQTPANAQESSKKETDDSSSGEHKLHLRLGPIFLGAGYSHFSGPGYYPYGPYGFYPFGPEYSAFWSPYWGPYSFFAPGYFGYGSAKGEVRLSSEPKNAQVYLDRAYAGTADHLKNIWLEPGAYDLSVAATGREAFHRRIYVLSGKSLKITAKLIAEATTGEGKDKP